MRVEQTGVMQFEVTSETDPEIKYHVDLLAYNCGGFCGCPDFSCRREKLVAKEQGISHCKHLVAAREFALDDILARIHRTQTETRKVGHYKYVE